MKRFTRLCLIFGTIFLLCGLAVTAAGYAGGALRDMKAPRSAPTSMETLDVPAEKLTILNMSLTSEDVNFHPSRDGDLHIEYPVREDVTYEYGVDGAAYEFYSSNSGRGWHWFRLELSFWQQDDSTINVYLPKNMGVQLSTTSGDILVQNLAAQLLSLSAISGEIDLETFTAQALTAETTSGEITASSGAIAAGVHCSSTSGAITLMDTNIATSLYCSTTSGEISLGSVTVDSEKSDAANLSSISGDIDLVDVTIRGGLDLSTTSGEIGLSPAAVYGDISAESTSGDVSLNLVGAPKHRIDHTSSTSGGISVTGGDKRGEFGISVSTTSGEIEIED